MLKYTIQTIPLGNIKAAFQKDIKPYPYQREPNLTHINAIKTYILDNYQDPTFYLPPILVAGLNPAYILDGLHRCLAIESIPDSHPCLNLLTTIHHFPNAEPNKQVTMFQNINKCIPVPDIYLKPNYLEMYRDTIYNKLISYYGVQLVDQQIEPSHCIGRGLINHYVSEDNIKKIMKTNPDALRVLFDNLHILSRQINQLAGQFIFNDPDSFVTYYKRVNYQASHFHKFYLFIHVINKFDVSKKKLRISITEIKKVIDEIYKLYRNRQKRNVYDISNIPCWLGLIYNNTYQDVLDNIQVYSELLN